MLLESLKVDTKEFLSEFDKRFKNFCKKAPLYLYPIITPFAVTVHLKENDEDKDPKVLFEYVFDYSISVKRNIHNIKMKLVEEFYPVMIESFEEEVEVPAEELNKMIENKEIEISDIKGRGFVRKKEVGWRIERIIIYRDEAFVRNLEIDKIYKFKLKMPVTKFLRKIKNSKDLRDSWSLFQDKIIPSETEEKTEEHS
jgi:hypothetical protein